MKILQLSQPLCGWKNKLIFSKFVLNFILIEHMQSPVRQFLQASFTNIIKGPFFICAFLGPESIERSEEQWTWLEKTLSSSKAHYLIVGGHFPVWSIAEHGPTQCLVDRLKPLLEKYKVTAYISGHDHNLQVIEYFS